MNKRDFAKHLDSLMSNALQQVAELPENAQVSEITVRDSSGFVEVPKGDGTDPVQGDPSTTRKEYRPRLTVAVKVKMTLRAESYEDRNTGKIGNRSIH